MLYLKIQNDQELVLVGKAVVSAGTTDLEAQFDVGDLYVGELIAYFNVVGRNDTPYSVTVADGKCLIPWEVLATTCADYMPANEKLPANINHIMIVSIADHERTTSSACRIPVYKSAFSDDAEEPTEPSDTLTQRILKKVPTKGSVEDNSMKFGNEYSEELFSVDVSGFGNDLAKNLERKIVGNKVYLSDYLAGEGVLCSISDKDSTITVEQVEALDNDATLSNSYDWYIIQNLINTVENNTTLVFDGEYIIDRPITIKRGNINLESLEQNDNARSLLRFTLTDKTTDFITIGLVGTSQIQNINVSGIRFRGSIDYDTGGYSGNGVMLNNSTSSAKSDCMNINFSNCDFVHFKNGICVGGAFYVSSRVENCYFGYNIENGFYGVHTGAMQLNELIFDNIGSLCNGLVVDTVNKSLVYKTEGESAIVNISGCGITLRNVGGMLSTYGIIINDGSTNGMNLSGMYLEACTVADVFIKGTNVKNLCILDAFSDMENKFISTDPTILEKSVIPLLNAKVVDYGVFAEDITVQHPIFHKKKILANNKYVSTFSNKDNGEVCSIKCNGLNNATISFDYEYIGEPTTNTYAYLEYSDMIDGKLSTWLSQEDKLYPSVLIKDTNPIGTIVALENALPTDVTHIVLRQLRPDDMYKLENSGVTDLTVVYSGANEVLGTNVLISDDRKTLDFSNSRYKSWFQNPHYMIMIPVAKTSSNNDTRMHTITTMPFSSNNVSIPINLNTESGAMPCYSEMIKSIKLCINTGRLQDGVEINISNVKINLQT